MDTTPETSAAEYRTWADAPETRRAVARQWTAWEKWATQQSVPPLPAPPRSVAEYLAHLASGKRWAASSTAQALWAINRTHTAHGYAAPGHDPEVHAVLAGIRRKTPRAPKQQRPLTIEDFSRLPRTMLPPQTALAARNLALLLLGFAACLRRSELAALDVADISSVGTSLAVRIRTSKTDPTGTGAIVMVPASLRYPSCCPVRLLYAWLSLRTMTPGPLFLAFTGKHLVAPARRISPTVVDKLVKQAASTLGLDSRLYGSHSLRAGGATYLSRMGVTVQAIARHGRWRSLDMVLHYCRDDAYSAIAAVL